MAVTNSGMTLYTNNDNESSWSGTDDADDYNNAIQGSNSESWQVSKNSTETGTLSKSADMSSAKYFNFYMSSNLAPYYTSIKTRLRTDTSNYEEWTSATSTDRKISGDFHPVVLEFGQGTETGTLNKSSIGSFTITVDNSSSGNIRSVINNWIDAMYYGTGRTIGGTTTNDELFKESHTADTTTNDTYDGCSELYKGSLAYQTDVTVNTSTGNSYGETVTFAKGYNNSGLYTLTISGTADFKNTNILGADGAKVSFTSVGATSFDMSGGGITNGGTVKFDSGQTISSCVLTSCDEVDTNGATFSNVTISDTTESTTGALICNSSSEINSMSNITINNYSSKYAIYIPASVTGTITLNNFQVDGSGTDVYWGGTSGTLTINKSNGTNVSTSSSGGGTVDIVSSVSIAVNVKNQSGTNIQDALVYIDEDLESAGNIYNDVTDSNGNISTSYSGSATDATIRVRKYGFKPFVTTVSLSTDSSTNVTLITDPQQQ